MTVPLEQARLDGCEGRYAFEDGFTLELARDGEQWLLKFGHNVEHVLAVGVGRFTSRRLPDILTCKRGAERRTTAIYSLSIDDRARRVK
jgi:hypothetical protein